MDQRAIELATKTAGNLCQGLRAQGHTIIYAGGTFDLFHAGHIGFFAKIRELYPNAVLVVSLNTDEFAERYKRRPIIPLIHRFDSLYFCSLVDVVTVNTGDEDSTVAISQIQPNFIAHGSDWTGTKLMQQMSLTDEFLDSIDASMLYVPYTETLSTSMVIKKIFEQEAECDY